MSENNTIVCPSCGIVNAASASHCAACGSAMEAVQPSESHTAQSAAQQSSVKFSQLPPWLKSIVGMFGLYVVAVIIYQWLQLPSGSVQREHQQQTAEHTHTDPLLVTRLTELEKQVAANPNNSELVLQFANLLHDAKFYPRAVEAYKTYLVQVPANDDARVDLGICYYELGESAAAIKEIESVIKKSPRHQMAMYNLGIIQLSNQNMAESQKWLKKCIEIDPQSTAGQRARQILEQHQ